MEQKGSLIQYFEVDYPHVITKSFLEQVSKKMFDKDRLVTLNGVKMTIPKYIETIIEKKMGNAIENFFKRRMFLGYIKMATPKTKKIIEELKFGTVPDEMKVYIPDRNFGQDAELDFSKLELPLSFIQRRNGRNELKTVTMYFDISRIPFGISAN